MIVIYNSVFTVTEIFRISSLLVLIALQPDFFGLFVVLN